MRSIEKIIAPPPVHMVGDGFRVHNFFPSSEHINETRLSPFFLMDYAPKYVFSPSLSPRGVGVHPHKGFETVTIAFKGKVAHHDSAGNSGIIGEGDVQWMTAGAGVLHKEYHDKEWSKQGGEFQMVQLWVNLPAKYKFTTPKYQALEKSSFGNYVLENDAGTVEVIAGNYKGKKGSASTFSPVELYRVNLKKEGKVHFSFPQEYNTALLVIEGSAMLDQQNAPTNHLILFKNDGTDIELEATENSVILVLSGEPIHEPLVHYGPFLMNTKAEILEAFEEFNTGKFGSLED